MLTDSVAVRAALLITLALLLCSGAAAAPGEIEILQIQHPSDIDAGEEIAFKTTVLNNRGHDIKNLKLALEAFEQRKVRTGLDIDEGESRTFTQHITVPLDFSGPETVQITATDNTFPDDTSTDIATTQVSADKLYMTMNLHPDEVDAGQQVQVTGQMSARNTEANLYFGGNFHATVKSGDHGHYSTTLNPEYPGTYLVKLQAGNTRVQKLLEVNPLVMVDSISAPSTVSTDDIFEVCATVSRTGPGETEIAFAVEGSTIETIEETFQGTRTECIETSIADEGEKQLTVTATGEDASDARSRTIQVSDTSPDVSVFPTDLTLLNRQSGVFNVEITNNGVQSQEYTVVVEGLESVDVYSTGTMTLKPGETRQGLVQVVPQELGKTEGSIQILEAGDEISETAVSINAVENPPLKSRIVNDIQQAVGAVRDTFQRFDRLSLAAIVAASALIAFLLWRRHKHRVMEPKY